MPVGDYLPYATCPPNMVETVTTTGTGGSDANVVTPSIAGGQPWPNTDFPPEWMSEGQKKMWWNPHGLYPGALRPPSPFPVGLGQGLPDGAIVPFSMPIPMPKQRHSRLRRVFLLMRVAWRAVAGSWLTPATLLAGSWLVVHRGYDEAVVRWATQLTSM